MVQTPDRCAGCGAALTPDETALTRKLVNRGTRTFFCLPCLARRFDVPEEALRRKIREFREMGCTLFPAEVHPAEPEINH